MSDDRNEMSDQFYVMSGKEAKEKYGFTAQNRPYVKLNPDKVPVSFRPLISYAETWGITDDLIRDDVIRSSKQEDLQNLVDVINSFGHSSFDEWLAGPESDGPHFSNEYVTFTALRMAAEEAESFLKNTLPDTK